MLGVVINRVSHFSRTEIAATFAAGSVAILISGLQPILLGAIVREGIMTLSLAGAMAGVEALFIGIGLVIATALSQTHRLRTVAVCGLVGLALGNFTCAIFPDARSLFILRSFTGVMSGIIIWAVTSVLIRTKLPGRIMGYFVATYTALQGACVLLLALYLMEIFGWRSCFLLIWGASMLALIFALKLPLHVAKLPKVIKTKLKLSLPVTCLCLIVFLQLIAFMSIWVFLEPIGEWGGISLQSIQLILSVSLFVQVLGAAVGGYLADKIPVALTLAVASAFIIIIGAYFFSLSQSTVQFFYVASLVFSFLWMLILPFHTQFAIEIDPSGNLALNIPVLQILGSVTAPVLGGILVMGGDARNVMKLAVSCSVAALLMTVLVIILLKRRTNFTLH